MSISQSIKITLRFSPVPPPAECTAPVAGGVGCRFCCVSPLSTACRFIVGKRKVKNDTFLHGSAHVEFAKLLFTANPL